MPATKTKKGRKGASAARSKGQLTGKTGVARARKADAGKSARVTFAPGGAKGAGGSDPVATLLALSAADDGYDDAMEAYGSTGVIELRALCQDAGLAPASAAKPPGLLKLIAGHAAANKAKADAAAELALPKRKTLIPKKKTLKSREEVDSSAGHDDDVFSDGSEASDAATPAKGRAVASGGWSTLAGLQAAGVITPFLADVMGAVCEGHDPSIVVQVLEAFRIYVHPPGTALEVGKPSAVVLDVAHLSRYTIKTKGGVKVALPATTPFSPPRLEFLAAMQEHLVARTPTRLEVAAALDFDTVFDRVLEAVFGVVYTPEVMKTMQKEYAAQCKLVATGAAKAAPAAGAPLTGPAFAVLFKGQRSAVEGVVYLARADLANDAQAAKIAASLRADQPVMPSGRATEYHLLRAPFDEAGNRVSAKKYDGLVMETSGGEACGVTAYDAETTAVKEGDAEAKAFSTAQFLKCVELLVFTSFVVVSDIKDGDGSVPRFSLSSAQKAVAAAKRLAALSSVTPAMYTGVIRQAYEKAAQELEERDLDAPIPKDGLVGGAFVVFAKRILEMVDQYALSPARAPVVGAGAPPVVEPAPKKPRLPKTPASPAGGGGAGGARPVQVRMPGGCGSGYSACTNKNHDPAQGGNPKAWCGLDHTAFGEPQPDAAKLKELQFKVSVQRAMAAKQGVTFNKKKK